MSNAAPQGVYYLQALKIIGFLAYVPWRVLLEGTSLKVTSVSSWEFFLATSMVLTETESKLVKTRMLFFLQMTKHQEYKGLRPSTPFWKKSSTAYRPISNIFPDRPPRGGSRKIFGLTSWGGRGGLRVGVGAKNVGGGLASEGGGFRARFRVRSKVRSRLRAGTSVGVSIADRCRCTTTLQGQGKEQIQRQRHRKRRIYIQRETYTETHIGTQLKINVESEKGCRASGWTSQSLPH